MTICVLHNRPNGCKMEENESQEHTHRHIFRTHFVIFFNDEPIGSFSSVQGDSGFYPGEPRSQGKKLFNYTLSEEKKKSEQTCSKMDCTDHFFYSDDSAFTWYMIYNNH